MPAFGAAIALSYVLPWLALGRAFSPRVLTATLYFALAGALASAVALLAARLFARRPWSARIAAVVICLAGGTAGFVALFLTLQIVLSHHRLSEIPIRILLIILAISGASETYNVLSIAAPLILPLGVPAILLFALLISGKPR